MKKWFAYGAIFLSAYLVFLIATLPASFIVANISLPKAIKLQGVSGTAWQMEVKRVMYADEVIEDVKVTTSALSLLTLDPELTVSFGDALSTEPEGQLQLSGLLSQVTAKNVSINFPASLVAEQMPLPIPMDVHNYVSLTMESYVVGAPICQQAIGHVFWDKASISALDETVKFGKLSAQISCEQGALAITVDPKNDLGLSFTAYVRNKGNVSGSGYLKPAANFPEKIKPLLSFLGTTDKEGRYRLKF